MTMNVPIKGQVVRKVHNKDRTFKELTKKGIYCKARFASNFNLQIKMKMCRSSTVFIRIEGE